MLHKKVIFNDFIQNALRNKQIKNCKTKKNEKNIYNMLILATSQTNI